MKPTKIFDGEKCCIALDGDRKEEIELCGINVTNAELLTKTISSNDDDSKFFILVGYFMLLVQVVILIDEIDLAI